jgi:acetyltransferase-like isoleucine patch superfamily enzyme
MPISTRFTIENSEGTSVVFAYEEATDTGGMVREYYTIEMSQEKSAGGNIKQQIRPGLRFQKVYQICLSESKYIDFFNLITENADDYYITYATAPTVLSNNSSISTSNNFKIAFNVEIPNITASEDGVTVYKFNMSIASVELF